MMELSEQKRKKLEKLARVIDSKEIGILEYLFELEEKFDETVEKIRQESPNLDKILEVIKGKDGHTPTQEELLQLIKPLIPAPVKGDTPTSEELSKLIAPLIPTSEEVATLALMDIELPAVEKVIEKVEVIRETPIVTENVVEKAVPDTGEETVFKINELPIKPEYQIDAAHIKNLPKPVFPRELMRPVGGNVEVYDANGKVGSSQRLRFIGTQPTVDFDGAIRIPGGSGGISQEEADARYLQLTTANGPLTGNLFVTKTDAKLRATDNTGSINYSELFANSTEVGFNFSIIDGESTGAIRYDGVSFSLSTNLSDAYTFSSSALLYSSGTSSSTQPAFYIIGDRAISGTNTNGGDVVITPGISRGSGTSKSILQASGGGASGTADSNPVTVATFAHNAVTLVDPYDFVFGTTIGTKIGTGTSQKIAFHGSTPVIQRAGAAQAAVATTAATNTTPFGYTTQAQADAIVTLVNEIRAALVQKGIIKGSA